MTDQEEQTKNSYSLIDVLKGKTSLYAEAYTNSQYQLEKKEENLRCEKTRHIKTLARLLKYEGKQILDEMFDYAVSSGMFLKCNSAVVDVKTSVLENETKTKVKNPKHSHYTIYMKFYKSAKLGDKPIYYLGNFLIKQFKETLHKKFLEFREKWTADIEINEISDIFGLTENELKE